MVATSPEGRSGVPAGGRCWRSMRRMLRISSQSTHLRRTSDWAGAPAGRGGGLAAAGRASGFSPGEIKNFVARTDGFTMSEDSAGRQSLDLRNKEIDDRFSSGLEFGVSRKGLRFREGALAGEKLKLFFNRLVRTDLGDRSIEDLALPLAIIATDIGTGERVAIRKGNLTSAMRASMSVPGLMAPGPSDYAKLVDGGLTDNLPIA